MKIQEITNTPIPHLLLTPDDNSNITNLIVQMGGLGERGDSFASLYKTGMPPNEIMERYDELLPNTQMIIGLISRDDDWTQKGATFNRLKETIDNNYPGYKPHFVGISLGAIAALKIPKWYPDYYASLGVLSGKGYASDADLYTLKPFYIVHNNTDPVVRESCIAIIDEIKLHPNVTSVILPDSGHNAWKWAFDANNPMSYYHWFKSKFIDNVDIPTTTQPPVVEPEPTTTLAPHTEVLKTVYVNGVNVGQFTEPITIKIE